MPARDKRSLQGYGVVLDLAKICKRKVNVYAAMVLMLQVSEMKCKI